MFVKLFMIIFSAAAEKPAESPLITGVNGSIIEGQNVTFTCSGNVGNPPGTFIWEKYRMIGFFPTTYADEPTTITTGLVNCTNNGTSSVTIAMESEDDRSLIRCVIKQEYGDVFQQTSILSVLCKLYCILMCLYFTLNYE